MEGKLRSVDRWVPLNSAIDLIKFAKEAMENFEIPANVSENLVYDLADSLEYITLHLLHHVISITRIASQTL